MHSSPTVFGTMDSPDALAHAALDDAGHHNPPKRHLAQLDGAPVEFGWVGWLLTLSPVGLQTSAPEQVMAFVVENRTRRNGVKSLL